MREEDTEGDLAAMVIEVGGRKPEGPTIRDCSSSAVSVEGQGTVEISEVRQLRLAVGYSSGTLESSHCGDLQDEKDASKKKKHTRKQTSP